MPLSLRTQPYYLVEKEFATFSSNLYKRRVNSDNLKENLFIKQKGICSFCQLPLINSYYDNFTLEVFGNRLQLHRFELFSNLRSSTLLHERCHLQITAQQR